MTTNASKPCHYCGGKGWRWGRAARSLGEKGYAMKRACGYCPAGKAHKNKLRSKGLAK